MNLESDIEELLYNYGFLTQRVHNALRKYEGIKQIKDLINEDGTFNHNPYSIPNIGKKSVPELRQMRVWFLENYIRPHQENQSMIKYEVTFRAAVKIIIEAKDSDSAVDAAWEEFQRVNELNDRFDHHTLIVKPIPTTKNNIYCMHEGEESWEEYDARGIYLTRVCDDCVEAKMAQYRKNVIFDPAYECDEQIEED